MFNNYELCPMAAPKNCKLLYAPSMCAMVRKDGVCLKEKKKTKAQLRAEKKERQNQ